MIESAVVESIDTVVIGAGQAGLAVGYYLAQSNHGVVILDANERIGDSWRQRWDSLRLFTPAEYNSLPGMPFPAPASSLPTKDDVAAYLEEYATRFRLPVHLHTPVVSLTCGASRRYRVTTSTDRCYEADHVVIATGAFQRPVIPGFSTKLAPEICQLHSSGYRNPDHLNEGDVLVVGAANSGVQIATELAQSRRVWLSGRNTGTIPRQVLGRDIFWWLTRTVFRLTVDSRIGKRAADSLHGGDPIFRDTAEALDRSGAVRVPRTTGVQNGLPQVGNDRVLVVTSVVWCTGYNPDFSWLELPVCNEQGYPVHDRGVVRDAPGLFVVGLPALHHLNSSLLGGVGRDAEHLAAQILSPTR